MVQAQTRLPKRHKLKTDDVERQAVRQRSGRSGISRCATDAPADLHCQPASKAACCRRLLAVCAVCLAAATLGAAAVLRLSSPAAAIPVAGSHAKFTLLTASYDGRAAGLPRWAAHYGRCPSVAEIVVAWNRGAPPQASPACSAGSFGLSNSSLHSAGPDQRCAGACAP